MPYYMAKSTPVSFQLQSLFQRFLAEPQALLAQVIMILRSC